MPAVHGPAVALAGSASGERQCRLWGHATQFGGFLACVHRFGGFEIELGSGRSRPPDGADRTDGHGALYRAASQPDEIADPHLMKRGEINRGTFIG